MKSGVLNIGRKTITRTFYFGFYLTIQFVFTFTATNEGLSFVVTKNSDYLTFQVSTIMKNTFNTIRFTLLSLLMLFSVLQETFAQETPAATVEKPSLKPSTGEMGFGLKANGLRGLIWDNSFDSVTLQFRRVNSPTLTLRADLGLNFNNLKTSSEDVFPSGDTDYSENSERSFSLILAPGVERHFNGGRRVDPYVGAMVPLAFVGKTHYTNIDEYTLDNGDYSKNEVETTIPGGLGIGLDGVVGVNYFVFNRLSIGVEYIFGFSLASAKGKVESKTTTRVKTGTTAEIVTTTDNDGPDRKISSIHFGNRGVFGLNLNYYFGSKE